MSLQTDYEAAGFVVKIPATVNFDTLADKGVWTGASEDPGVNPAYFGWGASGEVTARPLEFRSCGFSESDFPGITFNDSDTYSVEAHFACGGRRDEKTAQCYDYGTGTGFSNPSGTFDHGTPSGSAGAILAQTYNQTFDWFDSANERDFYSIFTTGADRSAMTAGYFSSTFGYDLVLYTEFGTQAYVFDWIMAMKVTVVSAGGGVPIDQILFSPTGNSNWARVRMNPLLRM